MKTIKSLFLLQFAVIAFIFAGCDQKSDTTVIKKDSTTTVNNNTQTTVVVPQTTEKVIEKSTTTNTTTPAPTTTTPSTQSSTTTTVTYPKIGKTWTTVTTRRTDMDKYIAAKNQPEAHTVVYSIRDLIRSLPSQSAALAADKRATLDKLVAQASDLSEKVDKYLAANDFANAKATSDQLNSLLDQIKILYPNESF